MLLHRPAFAKASYHRAVDVRLNTLATIRIGISGWRYAGWRGVFYPAKLPHRRELEFAATKFPTVEINGTFYSLQRPESFRRWSSETPDNFVFGIKGSRYLTHMLKLRNAETPLANLFASGLLELGPKLGPILWQFPPQTRFDPARFAEFFAILPRTHSEASALARHHDHRLDDRDSTRVLRDSAQLPIRHAIEIRHESFATEAFIQLLREHNVALVAADTVAWPLLTDVTSDFVYCRLHGSEELYASGYGPEALDLWADRVLAWATGGCAPLGGQARRVCLDDPPANPRDVYVYFDNDAKVRAPFDAQSLQQKITARLAQMKEPGANATGSSPIPNR
jgi:uncharacterized protein YecE (DUF72 family)